MSSNYESLLRTDLIQDSELLKDQDKVKLIVESAYVKITRNEDLFQKTVSKFPAKNIIEVMDLIKIVIEDYEKREGTTQDAKVNFVYEEPDSEEALEAISVKLVDRMPSGFGRGAPMENKTKQLRPLIREEVDDPDNPGYKLAILGMWYDNILRLTCWARTNKAANERALWLENVMEEYTFFFVESGVNRILYHGRPEEITRTVGNNKFYGRPIDYFVKTEKIRRVSQKTLEEIVIRAAKGQ